MIKRVIKIRSYWKVIVYFDIDYNFFHIIESELKKINCNKQNIRKIYYNMCINKAKAVTITNIKLHTSVVLFNKHKQYYDYINSIIHEAEHIKQSMLYAYNVDDYGEPSAYTIGYLASLMILKYNLYEK